MKEQRGFFALKNFFLFVPASSLLFPPQHLDQKLSSLIAVSLSLKHVLALFGVGYPHSSAEWHHIRTETKEISSMYFFSPSICPSQKRHCDHQDWGFQSNSHFTPQGKCLFPWTPPSLFNSPLGPPSSWLLWRPGSELSSPKEGPKNNLKLRVCVTVIREETKTSLFLIPKGSEAFRSVAMTLWGGCCRTMGRRHRHYVKLSPLKRISSIWRDVASSQLHRQGGNRNVDVVCGAVIWKLILVCQVWSGLIVALRWCVFKHWKIFFFSEAHSWMQCLQSLMAATIKLINWWTEGKTPITWWIPFVGGAEKQFQHQGNVTLPPCH